MNILLDAGKLGRHVLTQAAEQGCVDANPVILQLREHFNKRHFQFVIEPVQAALAQLGLQVLAQAPGEIGVLAGILRHPRRRHLVDAKLALALADQVADRDHAVIEIAASQIRQAMAALARMQQVVGEHRIAA